MIRIKIKKFIAMVDLYFKMRELKGWIKTCNDPVKLKILAGMYNSLTVPYNMIMPKIIKRAELIGTAKPLSADDIKLIVKKKTETDVMDA